MGIQSSRSFSVRRHAKMAAHRVLFFLHVVSKREVAVSTYIHTYRVAGVSCYSVRCLEQPGFPPTRFRAHLFKESVKYYCGARFRGRERAKVCSTDVVLYGSTRAA